MAVDSVIAFWSVSFLLVLTPGADWAYVIGAGLRERSVLPAVAGLLVGYVALTALVAAGVAALVMRSPTVMTVLTVTGACYLIWLGLTGLRRPAGTLSGPGQAAGSSGAQFGRGVAAIGLNPKALLLFVALLPQFTDPAASWPIAAQITVLGLVHVLGCAVVYPGVGVGARTILSARPGRARAVSRCSAGAMIAIGVALLVQHIAA